MGNACVPLSDGMIRDGQPIPDGLRNLLEHRFGRRLESVQLHFDTEANVQAGALCARAFTVGRHIVFGENEYHPFDPVGFRLLLHEVAHVIQQDCGEPSGGGYDIDPDYACEEEAEEIADGLAASVRLRMGSLCIQRHPGPPCPSPPQWVELTNLRPREIWLGANEAIETAYLAAHPDHSVLFGSQFQGMRDIRLPRGAPNRAGDNEILDHLRGLQWQRAPDIIDFTDRTVYEIKTVRYAREGVEQLRSLHRTLDAIVRQHGGANWNPDLSNWFPPHLLTFPSNPRLKVCTADTTHTEDPTGLVLYRVYARTNPRQERELARLIISLLDLMREFEPLREDILDQLARAMRGARSGEVILICGTHEFYEEYIKLRELEGAQRTFNMLQVQRRSPDAATAHERLLNDVLLVTGFAASVAFMVCGVMLLGGLGIAASAPAVAAAGSEAAGGSAVVVGGMTAAEAEVISLAAVRAARAAQAARLAEQGRKAATLLLSLSMVEVARAQGNRASVRRTGFLRAIPARHLNPDSDFSIGSSLVHQGEEYHLIGRAMVR